MYVDVSRIVYVYVCGCGYGSPPARVQYPGLYSRQVRMEIPAHPGTSTHIHIHIYILIYSSGVLL